MVQAPFVPSSASARLTEKQATDILLRYPKVAAWLDRYPPKPQTDAEYRPATDEWIVKAWSGDAGQIVLGKVDDDTGRVNEAWTGPQVAWSMARGGAGAFGGKTINDMWLWLSFCGLFLVGLADLRRLRSLRNLDLLALLSFSISLRFFNEGEIFWSAPLAYPPLVYLLGRCIWIARRDRPPRAGRPVWPVWLLRRRRRLPGRVPGRVERGGAAKRDRCRLRRASWARTGSRTGRCRTATCRCRRARSPAASRMPRARSASGSRRMGAARLRIRGATRTGPCPTSPTCPGMRCSAGPGSGTSSGLRTPPRSSSTRSACSAWRSSGGGSGGRGWRLCWRSRGLPIRSRSTSPTRTRTTRSCPPS